MSLPTIEKTWQVQPNHFIASGLGFIYSRPAFRKLKDLLQAFVSSPWTCSGSSHAGAAGMDGVDRLQLDGNFIYGAPGAPHSWIVLRQAGIRPKFEVLFDFSTSSYFETCLVVVSPSAGFGVVNGGTDGDISNRPTATDEYSFGTRGWGGAGNGSTKSGYWTALQSTDGACTRVFSTYNNNCVSFLMFDRVKDPVAHWATDAWVGQVHGGGVSGTYGSYATWRDATGLRGERIAGLTNSFYMTCEGYADAALGELMLFADDITGEYPLSPIGLFTATTGCRGRKGQMYDLWFGTNAAGLTSGPVLYPGDGSKQLIQVNNLVMPWDGVTNPIWL